MNDERIEFDRLIGGPIAEREHRVVRSVMAHVHARPSPRADLAAAILELGRPALAAAAVLALAAWLAPWPANAGPARPPTIGGALGIPLAAERVLHAEQPASAQQFLAAFQEER